MAGIASVHSAALLAEAYPDLCAGVSDRNAVATTLVVQDSAPVRTLLTPEKLLQKRLRAEGLQLKACRRSRFATASNVVDALLPASGAAYDQESTWLKPADHQFWGQDNSRLFSALYAPPRTPQDFMSTYVKCSVGSLDRELLKVVLKELLPSATFDDGVVAFAAQNNSTTSRPPLKALFDALVIKSGPRGTASSASGITERYRALERVVQGQRFTSTRWCGRAGRFCGFVRRWPALAATRGVRWEPQSAGCTPLPETHGACSGQRFVGLKVRRGVAGKALDHLLGLAATTPRIARPRRGENHYKGRARQDLQARRGPAPAAGLGLRRGLLCGWVGGGAAPAGRDGPRWSGGRHRGVDRGNRHRATACFEMPLYRSSVGARTEAAPKRRPSPPPGQSSTGTRAVTTSSGAPSADARTPRDRHLPRVARPLRSRRFE